MIEISSSSSPDQRNDTFRNHGAEENRTSVLLILDATGHQRTLCRVKTGNGTAGNADEHNREDRQMTGIGVRHPVRDFRQRRMIDEQHHQNADRHKQQSGSKQRIDFPDNLIDRQQGRQDVIQEHDNDPESSIQMFRCQLCQQAGRPGHKHGADQHHQDYRKTTHELLEVHAQVTADNLRQALPVMTQGQHPGQVIVY